MMYVTVVIRVLNSVVEIIVRYTLQKSKLKSNLKVKASEKKDLDVYKKYIVLAFEYYEFPFHNQANGSLVWGDMEKGVIKVNVSLIFQLL